MLMKAKIPLPAGHPTMDNYVCSTNTTAFLNGQCPVSISSFHPPVDAAINNASLVYPTTHPKVQSLMAAYLPVSHTYVVSLTFII